MAPPLGVYPIVQYPPPVEDLQTAECELDRTRTENTEAQRALFEYIMARKRKQLADWEDMLVRRQVLEDKNDAMRAGQPYVDLNAAMPPAQDAAAPPEKYAILHSLYLK
jgi:hypothetical protein